MLQTPPRQHYISIFFKSDVIALIIDHRFSPEKIHAHKAMSSARLFQAQPIKNASGFHTASLDIEFLLCRCSPLANATAPSHESPSQNLIATRT
jgi:hypothetical protein